jgi:hypothetical protein
MPWGSKMLLLELRERLRQGFLEFAWRQWAQLGVSANVAGADRWAIDPEALILFTIGVARRDPRLFDEMLDWLAENRRLLTIQRLRNLSARLPVDTRLVGAVVAWAESRPLQWPQNRPEADLPPHRVPVFSPDVLGFIGEPDPTFAKYGYIRPTAVRSGKSREPDIKLPANFAFQLRHLFGPGSRSEVMRILLTSPDGPLDAARIADEAGFAKRNVGDTLAGLVASRVVKARWSGNERHFIAYRDKWTNLLEVGPSAKFMPEFVDWIDLFSASLQIASWLDGEAETKDSDYLVSSRARELVERLTPNLEATGLDVRPRQPVHGVAYLSTFADIVEAILTKIGIEQ